MSCGGRLMASWPSLGQRAYELQRAGQISSASINELATAVDQLRSTLVSKEEELKQAQAEVFVEPPAPEPTRPAPGAQQVPISYDPPPASPPSSKICGICGFQMPATAMFCPNCGTRVG